MTEETKATYEELLEKVREYEIQETAFRTVIQQMEHLYSEIASGQAEIEKKNEELEEERRKLKAVLENIADGLVVVDGQGRIVLANQAFCEFFNRGIETIHNRHISEVIDNPEFVRIILQVLEEPHKALTAQIRLCDGRFIKNVSSSIQIDNLVSGVVSTFRDVTLEVEVDKMKTDFISTVSHELRTPLTSVLGFAKIIKKRLEDVIFSALEVKDGKVRKTMGQVRKNLDIIVSEGERLTALINDVLDLAKIESGRIEWRDEDVDVTEVFERAASAASALIQSKGLYLKKRIEGRGFIVRGDRDRLIQVVMNLFSNAVKFTDRGGITYRIKDRHGRVRCEVEDTGCGIPEGMLETIFEKFKQAGDTMTNKPWGTGLGLPICREIIRHHGGEIWADSREGGGSRFIFEIPLKEGAGPSLEEKTLMRDLRVEKEILLTSVENHMKTRGAILTVDDDAHIRRMLRECLEEKGYGVMEAEDAKSAIARARTARPSLILLDVMMPDLSGYDVMRVLKNDELTRDIPVIVVSVLEDREKALMLGASDYITKPVDEERLLQSISRVLEEEPVQSRYRVLIIEKDRGALERIASMMKVRGFDVIGCSGLEDEIKEGLRQAPELVLVDVETLGEEFSALLAQDASVREALRNSKLVYMIKGVRDSAKEDTDS